MKIKSMPAQSDYAPFWDISICRAFWPKINKVEKIRNFLLSKKDYVLSLPKTHDGGTDLGEETVTSRFGSYNLFQFKDECKEIGELLDYLRVLYVQFVRQEGFHVQDLKIVSWFNVMQKGDKIKLHAHGSGPDAYLSGNMHLDNYNTHTIYQWPYGFEETPIENIMGGITLFPSYFAHRTDEYTGEDSRVSIAFDLRLSQFSINPNLKYIDFMNEKLLKEYDLTNV